MHVVRGELSVGDLLHQIDRREILLPELQRDYVWRPTQVAKLVDSLYRGFPYGSLLFWQSDDARHTRELNVDGATGTPFHAPIYLLDGQQRLTSLHRVFADHVEAQIVFHLEKEKFQNQSALTKADPNWLKVHEVLDHETAFGTITRRLRRAGCQLSEVDIERRITRIRGMRQLSFQVQTLKGFDYDQVAEIFVRVNSAGRHLTRADLAMSTLSARWPGVLARFQKEANHWQRQGYADLGVDFLSRAFAATLFGGGLSSWSVTDVDKRDDAELETAWATVQRGLRVLIPLLRNNLGVDRSDPLPSLLPLIPLTVLLGEWTSNVDDQMAKAILYWFLVATMRSRYATSTDANLRRDIAAARKPDPTGELLKNIGVLQGRPEVTPESLAGRTKESPYFFLSLLAALRNDAKDFWFPAKIGPSLADDQELQFHHIHPVATLSAYEKGDVNDLANLAFISKKANLKISDKSPEIYFATLSDAELAGHFIPLDEKLRTAAEFPAFLAERRRLLAAAMTELLAFFRPQWLDRVPTETAAPTDGYQLTLVLYGSAWAPGRMVFEASGPGVAWIGSADMGDLSQAISAAGVSGLDGDVEIAGESVPVQVVEDSIELPVGPFLLSGSADEWEEVFQREQSMMQPLGRLPKLTEKAWSGERLPMTVTSTD